MANVYTDLLADHIPARTKRTSQKRCMMSLPPDEYDRMVAVAEAIGCSIPDTLITLLNFVDSESEG